MSDNPSQEEMSADLLKRIASSSADPSSSIEGYGISKKGVDTARTGLQFSDPAYFDPILFFLQHRDRKELNFRLRYWYEHDSIVGSAIDLHCTFPLSDFELITSDSTTTHHFKDWAEEVELFQLISDWALDYWLLGEVFSHGHWDTYNKQWKYFTMYPPEMVDVRRVPIAKDPLLYLEVDEKWRRLVRSKDPLDQAITRMIDRNLLDKIEESNKLILPPAQTVYFGHMIGRYANRGTSILKRCLYPLLYKHKLRLLQFTFADRHMFPLKIFKLGDPVTGWVPGKAHFRLLQQHLIQAANDPDYNIIFHHGLQVEYIGAKDKIENLIPHFEYADREIMQGLFTNEALLQGRGACYSPDTEVLTENGFKYYQDVQDDEKIATFNQDTGALEYQNFVNRIVQDFDGEMIHFDTGNIDILVTPNHQMLCQEEYIPRPVKALTSKKEVASNEVIGSSQCDFEDKGSWVVKRADEVKKKFRFRACIDNWEGQIPEEYQKGVLIPDACTQPKKSRGPLNPIIPLDTFLEFLGYYLSEGHNQFNVEKGLYIVSVSQSRDKSEYYEEMLRCIQKLPYKVGADFKSIRVVNKSFSTFIYELVPGRSWDKFIPKWIKNLPQKQLRILMTAMWKGDGCERKHLKGDNKSYSYFTSSKQLQDDVTEILIKLGYAPTLYRRTKTIKGSSKRGEDLHVTSIIYFSDGIQGKFPTVKSVKPECAVIGKVPYKGKVWCFEVPNHFFITRRNARIAIEHNTYANANVGVKVLTHRYLYMRDLIASKSKKYILKPMAQARGYFISDTTGASGQTQEKIQGKYRIIDVPRVKWKKINLLDDTTQKQMVVELRKNGRQVPHNLVAEMFDQDPIMLRNQLEEEEGTVVDPLVEKARGEFVGEPEVATQILQGVKRRKLDVNPPIKKETKPTSKSKTDEPSSSPLSLSSDEPAPDEILPETIK